MLEIKQVSKSYGKFLALEDVNLTLEEGVYGLLAPNGVGKTTLIKMLVTLLFPTKGEIAYNGKEIVAMDEAYRELIGYLPQQFGYYRNQTAMQYMQYLAALKGLKRIEAKQKSKELLELVGLEDVLNKKLKAFSGGMIQRVGIAQALLNDPKILVLDEPTAGLDPKERNRFCNLLSSIANDRIIIISTHIVSDVEHIANRIILIDNKKILANKTQVELLQQLEGQVVEVKINHEESFDFENNHCILGRRTENDGIVFRTVLNKEDHYENAIIKPATLEDVFLYVYR